MLTCDTIHVNGGKYSPDSHNKMGKDEPVGRGRECFVKNIKYRGNNCNNNTNVVKTFAI